MGCAEDPEGKLSEERLARVSVLQELTVAALDLFEPRRSMDDFLGRLATRLNAPVALCLAESEGGGPARLLGAAGLSRVSRSLPLPPGPAVARANLPYPEIAALQENRWELCVSAPQASGRGGVWLLVYFSGPPPDFYFGVVERLVDILRSALLHRQLYARTLESERRLFEQKTLLECQAEAALDGILFVSVDGKASYNRRFSELFGLPPDGSALRDISRRLLETVSEPANLAARIERPPVARREEAHVPVLLRDGKVLDASSVPIQSADGIYFGRGWFFRDVTAQVQIEQERAQLLAQEQAARTAAEEAQRRSDFLAEASRTLAASLDYAVTLERVAHLALPDFADWCAVDLVEDDQTVTRIAMAHASPEKGELVQQLRAHYTPNLSGTPGISRALRLRRTEFYPEIDADLRRRIARDERHLRLLEELGSDSAIIAPLIARGRLLGAIALVYGDSKRRYRPADVQLAEDLARRAAMAVDNARLHLRLQEAVRAREEFLSIASHELRTPMTSLHLALQGLVRLGQGEGFRTAPADFVLTSLQTAERQSARLVQLIESLLDLSHIHSGRLELQLERVDLVEVVREQVAQSAVMLEQAGCAVRLQAPAPVVGEWDRTRVEQVVGNLLSNAAKYGAGRPIEVGVRAEQGRAELSIADHGIGIAPEKLPRIFERFERAVSSRHYSGLGLGLYIVKRVVDTLGGSIRVESQLGQGTRFIVDLPMEPPRQAANGKPARKRGAA